MSARRSKDLSERTPPAILDSREAQRVSFRCPVVYTSEDGARRSQKKGQLLDLSKKGLPNPWTGREYWQRDDNHP